MKKTINALCTPCQTTALLRACLLGFLCMAVILAAGCATVGQDFPVDQVKRIEIGETTKAEIRAMFGEPWRVGLEDGLETWTYGQYKYKMFSDKDANKDLVVRFTDDDIVDSYTFNMTNL